MNSHYKRSYIYNENPHTLKDCIFERLYWDGALFPHQWPNLAKLPGGSVYLYAGRPIEYTHAFLWSF